MPFSLGRLRFERNLPLYSEFAELVHEHTCKQLV